MVLPSWRALVRGLFRTAPEHTVSSPVTAADPIVADPALLQAIKAEDVTAVETLLKKGSNPRGRVGSQKIPLLTIVVLKRQSVSASAILRALLDAGADTEAEWWDASQRGSTALMIAAEERKPEFVQALLAAGADPDHADGNGLSAFMRGSSDDVRAILAAKTQRQRLDLASALAAVKTLDDRSGDDQAARTYQDPITIEPRCTNCGYYQHVDFTCIQHADPRSHTPTRLSIARDSAYELCCEKWEDEQLIALLQKGCAPTDIAYHRRHPQLIRSEERLQRWRDYWATLQNSRRRNDP